MIKVGNYEFIPMNKIGDAGRCALCLSEIKWNEKLRQSLYKVYVLHFTSIPLFMYAKLIRSTDASPEGIKKFKFNNDTYAFNVCPLCYKEHFK